MSPTEDEALCDAASILSDYNRCRDAGF